MLVDRNTKERGKKTMESSAVLSYLKLRPEIPKIDPSLLVEFTPREIQNSELVIAECSMDAIVDPKNGIGLQCVRGQLSIGCL